MKVCQLCESADQVMKRRIQILPSFSKCVHVCRSCLPKIHELIVATRDAYMNRHNAY